MNKLYCAITLFIKGVMHRLNLNRNSVPEKEEKIFRYHIDIIIIELILYVAKPSSIKCQLNGPGKSNLCKIRLKKFKTL